VLHKTLRKSFWLVLALVLLWSSAWSTVAAAKSSPLIVSIHNDAAIPSGILLQAEAEASRVFQHAGLEIRWSNCPLPAAGPVDPAQCEAADFPLHLQLRIAKHSLNLNEFTMGVSYLSADGTGCYADLFYDRAEHLHEISGASLASILGHAIAHELGHLLLGTNSHSPAGIMRARWQPADLASASKGALLFSTLESHAMKNMLDTWPTRKNDDSHIATARPGD
jgi:hypothetical protein